MKPPAPVIFSTITEGLPGMCLLMCRPDGPTIRVETSARSKSYDQTKRLSFVESFVGSSPGNSRDAVSDNQAGQEVSPFAVHKCSFLVRLAGLLSRSN